jgi:chemotaxis protein MotB
MAKHGGHHGGSWKVAYADFVTAMMALFLVLWLTAQDAKIKEAIERAFRNPFSSVNKESVGIIPSKDVQALQAAKGQYDSVSVMHMELLRRLTEDLAKMLQQDPDSQQSVKYDLASDGLHINVFDRSRRPIFEPDSARFTSYGSWVFSTLAWEVSRYPGFSVELTGHTEAGREAVREDYGVWELSADRASAARRKLVQYGIPSRQIFKVSGFGDTQPMENTSPTNEINRRVSMVLRVVEGNQLGESAAK